MYESPIEKVVGEIQSQIIKQDDENIMYAVKQAVGYSVDKNELIKALKYDRGQYEKGYRDGLNADKWIPVSERLPDNTDPVNITWVNHDPESYYADIKDKPFTATGHYCNGRWWWYSVTCQDYLDEYGRCDVDAMDDAIEVIAWMPLPKPYEPQERSGEE